MSASKISNIVIEGLFGKLDHPIKLNDEGITFIHGPNGCGKTTVLSLIHAVFSWNLLYLFDTVFDKISITRGDTVFTVMKINDEINQNEVKSKGFRLIFSINRSECEDYSVSQKSELRLRPSMVEDFFPFLVRQGLREWFDKNTGKTIDLEGIFDKYGYFQIDENGNQTKRPEWIDDYMRSINVHFIKTQRLLSVNNNDIKKRNSSDSNVTDIILIYSQEIVDIISRRLAEQATVAQVRDRSFPERLLLFDENIEISEEEIREKYSETEEKIIALMNVGLIDKQENISLPEKRFEDTEKKVLSLYLNDVNEKLSVFDDLQKKIEIFINIVGNKLRTKFSVNKTDGFVIESIYSGEKLHPTQLSSGEQHQIVLFYELIFKAEENSFFLIDEPEISLHVDWQRSFIKDVIKVSSLGDREFLIATHSPQIIGGRIDLAVALKEGVL